MLCCSAELSNVDLCRGLCCCCVMCEKADGHRSRGSSRCQGFVRFRWRGWAWLAACRSEQPRAESPAPPPPAQIGPSSLGQAAVAVVVEAGWAGESCWSC